MKSWSVNENNCHQSLCPKYWNGLHFIYFFKRFDFFILGRVGERGKIDVWAEHRRVASCMHPERGPGPPPRHMPWPGIEPVSDLFLCRLMPNWAAPVRAGMGYVLKGGRRRGPVWVWRPSETLFQNPGPQNSGAPSERANLNTAPRGGKKGKWVEGRKKNLPREFVSTCWHLKTGLEPDLLPVWSEKLRL